MSFKKEQYTWKTYKVCVHKHPELEKLLPLQTDEEIQALDDSLKSEGLRDAITVCNIEGKQFILDGYTRTRRLIELGLLSDADRVAINNKGSMTLSEAIAWIIERQLSCCNTAYSKADILHLIGKLYNATKRSCKKA